MTPEILLSCREQYSNYDLYFSHTQSVILNYASVYVTVYQTDI